MMILGDAPIAPHSNAVRPRRWTVRVLALGAALAIASPGARSQSCTVAQGGVLAFPGVVALASSGNQTTDSGQSFKVSCDSSVVGILRLYSATPRIMSNGGYSLPFNLSMLNGASSNDLSMVAPGTEVNIPRDGQAQTVTLYAKIFAQNFRSLPAGLYSTSITLTLEY
jgi:spore coat protein U-like protein